MTKLLSLFLHPLTVSIAIIGVGGAIAWRRGRLGALVVGGGLALLWIASMPAVAGWLQWTLESRYPPRAVQEAPHADAIVTLGGSVSPVRPPRIYPDLNGSVDRVWHAARLFHAQKAPLVIVSGGTMPWKNQAFREAPAMKRVLVSLGVPADSVVLESRSANTYENAVHTADVAARMDVDTILLVTSALHMRRALDTFRQAGLKAVPAPTDHRVVQDEGSLLDLFPTSDALSRTKRVIREYVGYMVYDLRGWIADCSREQLPRAQEASEPIASA